jgi:serine/threonine protein kinase
MAPEQAAGKGKEAGPGADVYGLGAILYDCLTGRPPFQGPSPLDTMVQVISTDPVPPRQLQPKVPRDLETICLKCLEKTPQRRYDSAEALADELQRYLALPRSRVP